MLNFAGLMNTMTKANDARMAKEDVRPVSDKQWDAYVRISRQKFVPAKERSSFNMTTISQEMNRLIQLPNAYAASVPQINRYKDLCLQLNIAPQDTKGWSNVYISERITALSELVPPTHGQFQLLFNMYRFGIIADIPNTLSMNAASTLIAAHEEDYRVISENMATLAQCARIQEVEARSAGVEFDRSQCEYVDTTGAVRTNYAMKVMLLQGSGKVTDIVELSKLTFEQASERIEKLEAERQAMRDVLKSQTMYHEGVDNSRSVDMDEYRNRFDQDKDLDAGLNAYHAIKRLLGQQWDEDDADLNEQNIQAHMEQLIELAIASGVKKGAIQTILEDNLADEQTQIAPEPKKPVRNRNRVNGNK